MTNTLQLHRDTLVRDSVRTAVINGEEYLVAPCTMLVSGVLGGEYVPIEELDPNAWNGRPVTVNHPTENGQAVSAGSPDQFARVVIGTVFDTKTINDRLTANLWINVVNARARGYGYVLDRIKNGDVMEVSTGYFRDEESSSGVFNGRSYETIARRIRPDHLALLPDHVGACSVRDGCGTPRTNHLQSYGLQKMLESLLSVHTSYRELEGQLMQLLQEEGHPSRIVQIIDVNDDGTFIYQADRYGGSIEDDPLRTFRRTYSKQGDDVTLGDNDTTEEVRVVERREYVPIQTQSVKGNLMKCSCDENKTAAIQDLIDNEATSFTEDDREALGNFSIERLKALSVNSRNKDASKSGDELPQDVQQKLAKLKTYQDAEDAEREEIITKLRDNDGDGYLLPKDDLDKMSLSGLRALHDRVCSDNNETTNDTGTKKKDPATNYAGRGQAVTPNQDKNKIAGPPAVLLNKPAAN